MTIRVPVTDDQSFIRTGLVTLFTAAPGLEVVGEAADGEQAAALAAPDVVLMDIRMPSSTVSRPPGGSSPNRPEARRG
ncbi:response regulator transcription factor [Kibdelosporangium phytohabitans]|uniref:Response regulatory domain-containing protein n=1 Tax=Kibdelosporangium phytohabitans TaxID=860235 RepID=A0A0N9I4N4_9PSEU|nr:hypothetical protein AOZ06_24175 [Kibdelosporangium phytohabitans]MBE1469084.1 YesN/AraC family two-component response regulator [Kibdelosporangium phytohabitans]